MYKCSECGKSFETKKQFQAHFGKCKPHIEHIHEQVEKICPICGKTYITERNDHRMTCSKSCGSRLNALNKGQKIHLSTTTLKCAVCGKEFETMHPECAKICSHECMSEYNKLKGFIQHNNLPASTTYKEYKHLSEMIPKQCIWCGKTFLVQRIDFNTTDFCSTNCKRAKAKEDSKVEKICPICGESYRDFPTSTRKTCGKRSCADKQMQATRRERGYIGGFANPDIQKKIVATNIERYGVPYYCMTDACKEANERVVSSANIAFHNKLLDLGIENDLEYTIDKFSFDIRAGRYLIEIDPAYTHSCTTASIFDKPKARTYHQTKTIIANGHGFNCVHIFEWEDEDKITEILNPSKRRIYARDCSIKEVDKKEADQFLTTNHLQGTLRIQPIRFGLYHDDELVQLMTFGKPRYNKNFEYELLRLCTTSATYVVGGAEKLFKKFVDTYSPKSVISYCDNSKFNGDVYIRLGFCFSHITQPSIHWYNMQTKQHITDQLLRQHGADRLIGTRYGKGTNNQQILLDNGFVGVADCGQKVYEWKSEK